MHTLACEVLRNVKMFSFSESLKNNDLYNLSHVYCHKQRFFSISPVNTWVASFLVYYDSSVTPVLSFCLFSLDYRKNSRKKRYELFV